jgi:hypothetical protein
MSVQDAPPTATYSETLAKCEYFMQTHLWPLHAKLDPERWLSNFVPSEVDHALQLLNGFLYYSDTLSRNLFLSAFQDLSMHEARAPGAEPFSGLRSSWRTFCDNALVTYVTGEDESPTDSGYKFARMARDYLNIDETRILAPAPLLEILASSGSRPVIFVDDFVGTGQQFVTTWRRRYRLGSGITTSFEGMSSIKSDANFVYCTLIATEQGLQHIAVCCPAVVISAAHVLSPRYSALHPQSLIWPEQFRPTANAFLRDASLRAGLPDTNGASVDDWQGYNRLGLALAFEHSTPDATLGILRWAKNGWRPLVIQS